MTDDKNNRTGRDSATVSGSEPYEVSYFAKKHGISTAEAQALIDRVGNNRDALDAAAQASTKPTNAGTTKTTRSTGGKTAGPARPKTAKPAQKKSVSAVQTRAGSAGATIAAAEAALTKKVVRPVTRAATNANERIGAAQRNATKVVRKGSAAARGNITRASKAVRRSAGGAVDTAMTAATSKTASILGVAAVGLVAGLAANIGRKALVQAPSTLAGDWFAALKAEHKLALALFDKIEATTESQGARRSVLLVQLKHALAKHAFTEENVIYPALRTWGDKADADKLNHDHGYVKQYLYDLEAIDNASPAFLATLAEFRAALESHIREEEEAIFPPLHAGLGKAGNAKLTAQANKEGFKLA